MTLPIFQTQIKEVSLLQTSWKAAISPILNNEINQGILLSNIAITMGVNQINHLLGRNLIGWIITDKDSNASLYRSEPLNNKTLTLTSDANCTISIWVF